MTGLIKRTQQKITLEKKYSAAHTPVTQEAPRHVTGKKQNTLDAKGERQSEASGCSLRHGTLRESLRGNRVRKGKKTRSKGKRA